MSRRCGREVSRTRTLRSIVRSVSPHPATATFEWRVEGDGAVDGSEVSRGGAPRDVSGPPAVFMTGD